MSDQPQEEEVKQPAKKASRKKVVKEQHTNVNIFTNLAKLDLGAEGVDKLVLMPSGEHATLSKLLSTVDNIDDDKIIDALTDEERASIGFNVRSEDLMVKDGDLDGPVNSGGFVNNPTHNGKRLGIRGVPINAKGRLSGADAVAAFTSGLGVGKHTAVTLWHSGFTLLISPPRDSEILNLHFAVANADNKLGMDTNNLIYSNYGAAINKLVVDFVLEHVISSSLALPEGGSYLDYILTSDLESLVLGVVSAMYPKGYSVIMSCRNSQIFENNKPLCDFSATLEVNPDNLLRVNRKVLTPELLVHISKATAGSQSVEDVLTYQNALTVNDPTVVKVASGSTEVEFEVATPTLRRYLDSGNAWINSVIADAEGVFTDADTEEVRERKISAMACASVLNKYNSYITKISSDDAYVDDEGGIMGVLTALSKDPELVDKAVTGIRDYINNSYIAVVATANYNCPTCKAANRDPSQGAGEVHGFKEFIPLNVVEHFFDLSTLKFSEVVARDQ